MTDAVELPRPHGEGPPVPPMWVANLDAATLAELVADLSSAAEVLSVRVKGGSRQYTSPDPLTLEAARDRLAAGDVTGVQVRYRYDGQEWTDTLIRGPEAIRLVRCRTPES